MDDASLDDFMPDSDESDAEDATPSSETTAEPEPDSPSETAAEEGDSPAVTTADVEPAVSTYAWSSDETACEACGERVERRWRDDGELVCSACKDW